VLRARDQIAPLQILQHAKRRSKAWLRARTVSRISISPRDDSWGRVRDDCCGRGVKPYDSVMKRLMTPRLAALGFARYGSTFNRCRRFRVEVISFQRSQYNTSRGALLTVNVGIASAYDPRCVTWMAAVDCPIQCRVGSLRPEREDLWYRYLPEEQTSTDVAVAAMRDIESHVFPFFERRPPPEWLLWLVAAPVNVVTRGR
jgi:Domain of unknown function (DUF4304)